MTYQVSRNGQTYGPYTLEDLQRYVASGNVLPTDLAKSEEMSEWTPVAQILSAEESIAPLSGEPTPAAQAVAGPGGTAYTPPVAGAPFAPAAGYAQPYSPGYNPSYNPATAAQYPDPPNLHWGLVLLFSVLTCGLFIVVWNLIVTAWLRRVQPNATALFFYAGAYALAVVNAIISIPLAIHAASNPSLYHTSPIGSVVGIAVWVIRLIARYSEKASLEEHFSTVEPIGMSLNPVMIFFFGGLYIQSQLNRVNLIKQSARFGTPRPY